MYNAGMTFVLHALRDKPRGLFRMDDTSPIQDYSGYGRTAVFNGTPTKHTALVRGASYAPVLTNTITAEFSYNVFNKFFERDPFTLAAWVRVVSGTSEQQVLGNQSNMDGITINGTVVSFVTKYTTEAEARCSYDIGTPRKISVFGVHTKAKNMLYVDGELVDEVTLTEAQQADTFQTTSANLFGGSTAGGQSIAVNGVAYYSYALSGPQIARQHLIGSTAASPDMFVSTYNGDIIDVSLTNVDIFSSFTWNDFDTWSLGQLSNVAIVDNELVPQFEADVSMLGYWYDTFPMGTSGSTSIYGVSLDWDGRGAVVEVSLDGTTWETAQRNKKVALIPAGFDPTDEVLLVRASFPGGITDDESYLSSLTIRGIKSNINNEMSGRTVTYTAASPMSPQSPFLLDDNWGVSIDSGGSVVISADTISSRPARTLELWVKRTGANPTITGAGTYYQNGIVDDSTLDPDRWTLLHLVWDANVTTAITLSGPLQIGQVVVYPAPLTAGEVAQIYANYTGSTSYRVTDSSVIAVTESASAADIYAYDWSITGAG